jgi:DNA-binding NtrC family response regulator
MASERTHMILCISRDDGKLTALGEILRTGGHEVFLCVDPADALRILAYASIAMVVIDEALASSDGRAVQQKARSFFPRIPVIYRTDATEPTPAIAELDPDVIISRADGDQELLKVIAILKRA